MANESDIPGVDLRACALVCEQNRDCQAAEEATKVGLDERQPFFPRTAEAIVRSCTFATTGRCALVLALVHNAAEKGAM